MRHSLAVTTLVLLSGCAGTRAASTATPTSAATSTPAPTPTSTATPPATVSIPVSGMT